MKKYGEFTIVDRKTINQIVLWFKRKSPTGFSAPIEVCW